MFSGQDILKKGWRGFANRADTHRAVADYIAGMTDRFALREHFALTGQEVLPAP